MTFDKMTKNDRQEISTIIGGRVGRGFDLETTDAWLFEFVNSIWNSGSKGRSIALLELQHEEHENTKGDSADRVYHNIKAVSRWLRQASSSVKLVTINDRVGFKKTR